MSIQDSTQGPERTVEAGSSSIDLELVPPSGDPPRRPGRRPSGVPKPNNKTVTFEFYRVNCGSQNPLTLTEIATQYWTDAPAAEMRNQQNQGEEDAWRLHGFEKVGKTDFKASLLRIRKGAAPNVVELNSDDVEEIPLRPNQHLVDYFCFAYFDEFQVLVLQRNRDAGGQAKLSSYLRHKTGQFAINFEAVQIKDALGRLRGLVSVSRAELRLAVPTTNSMFDTHGHSVNRVASIARDYNGTNITVIITQGNSGRALFADKIKDLMTGAIELLGKEGVKAAKVKGHDRDLDIDLFLDLMEGRMEEQVETEYFGNQPSFLDYEKALQTAYDARKDELRSQFLLEEGEADSGASTNNTDGAAQNENKT